MSRSRLALALPVSVAFALMLTACGDATETPPKSSGTSAWESQQLAVSLGADQAPLIATSGNDAVILTLSEQNVLLSQLSSDGGPFVAGQKLKTDVEFLQLGEVVRLPDGDWFAAGSGGSVPSQRGQDMTFEAVAFRSDDGLAWQPVEITGFDGPVDVNDVVVVDGTIVVAGAHRTGSDPSMGGFEAQLWTSTDGVGFTETDLPDVPPSRGYRTESYAGTLVAIGDRLLASGRVGRSAALWSSDDGGQTWQRSTDPAVEAAYSIDTLASVGDVLVAAVSGGKVAALRSTDLGASWAPVAALPTTGEDAMGGPVWSSGQRFWALTGIDDEGWSQPEVCYADLDQCGKNPPPRLMTSIDGVTWIAAESPGGYDEITGTADGRVLTIGGEGRGLAVHSLPAGAEPPAAAEAPQPEKVDLVKLAKGERPTVGVRYHAPMYLHCGMGWFWFGEATWKRTDDGANVETGAGDYAPEGWPVVGQTLYGYATLIDEDHLAYSIGDEVIATYQHSDGAPGCD